MATASPTIHASAVLIGTLRFGAKAALIRGPAGAGKSRLVLALLQAAEQGALPFARLVADDRAAIEARSGRLLVRPAEPLAGMIEIRGLGIQRVPHEPVAVAGLVVDLGTAAERLPSPEALETTLAGIRLPRLAIPAGTDPLPVLLAYLRTPGGGI
jgi:HPr kinase/phosphorylase